MSSYIIIYILLINVFTFFVYGYDKNRAVKHKWRVSERTLLLLAVIGGSIGAAAGMLVFHHKTKKPKFTVSVPVIFFVQLVLTFKIYYN